MSLILEDPKKYQEMKDKFLKEDETTLKNTIEFMRNMSDGDISDLLDGLGRFLHHIRVNNNMSLRAFSRKYNLSPVIVSEIERGLRLPNIDVLDIYLRDDIKEKNVSTPVITKLDE